MNDAIFLFGYTGRIGYCLSNRLNQLNFRILMHVLLNLVTLPFIGEVNLSAGLLILFFICLLCVVGFEFVNGFHDTANAVATVIYTKALKPMVAVPWSGMWNFTSIPVPGRSINITQMRATTMSSYTLC